MNCRDNYSLPRPLFPRYLPPERMGGLTETGHFGT